MAKKPRRNPNLGGRAEGQRAGLGGEPEPHNPPFRGGAVTTPYVGLKAVDADIPRLVALLRNPVSNPVPRPRIVTVERPGTWSLTEYAGHDPYMLTLPLRFDRWRTGEPVEDQMRLLERLAERQKPTLVPPIVRVRGPVPHKGLRWWVSAINVDDEQTLWTDTGDARTRIIVDVELTSYHAPDTLDEDLGPLKSQKGIATRTTRVREGESDLYAVARRVYHDPSRASDIARANHIPLGTRLKTGRPLRIPT